MSEIRQIHDWFLHRGLPLVLTRRVRSRALIARSAPMVAGVGTLTAVTLLLADWTGADPDYGYIVRLAIIAAALAAAPFALYVLHQRGTTASEAGRRTAALAVMAAFVLLMPVIASGWSTAALAEVPAFLLVSLLAVWFTYLGFGSILLWAFRFAWVQLSALGTLMSRALPLLMLTVVVYFTGELWQLAARMTRQRLWQTIGFLAVVALVFMIATIRDEVRALREDRSGRSDPALLLAGNATAVDDGTLPGADPAVAGRTGQRGGRHGCRTSHSGRAVHRGTVGVFPGSRRHRHTRRRDGVVVRRGDLRGRRTALRRNLVRRSHSDTSDRRAHLTVRRGAVRPVLHVSTSVDPMYRQRFFEPLIADVAVSLAGRDAYLEMENTR